MQEPRQVYRRRRAALAAVAGAAALAGAVLGAQDPGAGRPAPEPATSAPTRTKAPELPRGGRTLFPRWRVVAFYGAPQAAELGALGIGTPAEAARRLERQARAYARRSRPVLPAFELLATIANRDAGRDGMYRTRQSEVVIDRYLRAARRAKALLVLDIQPGHADFMDEARRLERWLREPDVGLALDPEWHTPGQVPGTAIGSVTAAKVNQVARWLARIVRERNLPEKLFVVHQFTPDMIRDKQSVTRPRGLAVTMNVDGFGDRANKLSKYRLFTRETVRFHDGFKLFYREDTGLLSPRSVLGLTPPPDVVVYE